MPASDSIIAVPEMSNDPRVRVFRRTFTAMGEFEGMQVDAYLVITDRYLVMLDTMLCPEDAATMMQMVHDELAGRQVLVINSHADWDHAWGNNYFTGEHAAPIIAHEYCRTRLQSQEAREGLADYQSRYPLFRSVVLTPPTLTFQTDLTIHGGDLTLELIPAPGHHPDHIAAWIPELRLLLAFDAVEMPLPLIESADTAPYMFATLEHFLTMQPARVLCSHGKTTSPELVQENLSYLREIEQRCHDFLSTRRPTDQELEQAADLINYPFDEVVPGKTATIDRTFYSYAHNNNVRCIMQWLMS